MCSSLSVVQERILLLSLGTGDLTLQVLKKFMYLVAVLVLCLSEGPTPSPSTAFVVRGTSCSWQPDLGSEGLETRAPCQCLSVSRKAAHFVQLCFRWLSISVVGNLVP